MISSIFTSCETTTTIQFQSTFLTHGCHGVSQRKLPVLPNLQGPGNHQSICNYLPILGISHMWNQLCAWLLSLSTSRFTHVITCISTSWLNSISPERTYCCLSSFQLREIWVACILGYYESCRYEHSCTSFCVDMSSILLDMCLRLTLLGSMSDTMMNSQEVFNQRLYRFTIPPAVYEGSNYSTFLPILTTVLLLAVNL